MSSVDGSGTFRLGDVPVKRLGYGAMRLSGPGTFGRPRALSRSVGLLMTRRLPNCQDVARGRPEPNHDSREYR